MKLWTISENWSKLTYHEKRTVITMKKDQNNTNSTTKSGANLVEYAEVKGWEDAYLNNHENIFEDDLEAFGTYVISFKRTRSEIEARVLH